MRACVEVAAYSSCRILGCQRPTRGSLCPLAALGVRVDIPGGLGTAPALPRVTPLAFEMGPQGAQRSLDRGASGLCGPVVDTNLDGLDVPLKVPCRIFPGPMSLPEG